MKFKYDVKTVSGLFNDNLEDRGELLKKALNGRENASKMLAGWELWQINTVNNGNIYGLILVYRRVVE